MAGLIQQAQSAGSPPAPPMPGPTAGAPAPSGAPPAGPGAAKPGAPNPQNVARILTAAMKLIHDPKGVQAFVDMLKTGGDPVAALAHAAMAIMGKIYDDSKGSVPIADLGMAAAQIIKMLAELAHAAKLFDVPPEMLKQALQALGQLIQQQQQGGGGAQPPAPAAGAAGPTGAPPAGMPDQSQAMA